MCRNTPNRMKIALLVMALLVGGLAGLREAVAGGEAGSDWSDGDNPVVGSLPCMADPSMDSMFWLALGHSDRDELMLQGQPPVLGVIGDRAESDIQNAWGTPFGRTNGGDGDWNAFGMSNGGTVVLRRAAIAEEELSLWQWVPDGYVGGTFTVSSGLGTDRHAISSDLISLPMLELAMSPPTLVGIATLTIEPNEDNTALPCLHMTAWVANGSVFLEYTP